MYIYIYQPLSISLSLNKSSRKVQCYKDNCFCRHQDENLWLFTPPSGQEMKNCPEKDNKKSSSLYDSWWMLTYTLVSSYVVYFACIWRRIQENQWSSFDWTTCTWTTWCLHATKSKLMKRLLLFPFFIYQWM